jgi:GPH family glycoside/pentoside/hexuronide:cation symporter
LTLASVHDESHRPRLAAFGGFAAVLAAAGLPIYIHAPKVYVDSHGVGLAEIGAVLVALRLIDVVQDPALGWLAGRLKHRATGATVGVAVLAISMLGLFAIAPPLPALIWFALTLTLVFSAYSWLTILFYAQGVRTGESLGNEGHVRLATWREAGALTGVCIAAVTPTLLDGTGAPFVYYALLFAVGALIAGAAMRDQWQGEPIPARTPFRPILRDRTARRLLLIALVNAAPVAVTSTLFLFFVESRLAAPGWEGPLLLVFFLAAALSTPGWGRAARAFGPKAALLGGMVLSVVSFAWAATLGSGDIVAFAVVCVASGAALGADLTLLPALFSARLASLGVDASAGFGLWAFVSKFTLALAAAVVLPALDAAGFRGPDSPPAALSLLAALYALLPCGLKLGAIALLALTKTEGT